MFSNKKLTTLTVLVAVVTAALTPGVLSFLPDTVETTVQSIAAFLNMVFMALGFKTTPGEEKEPGKRLKE